MFNIGDEVRVIKSEVSHHSSDLGCEGCISHINPAPYDYEVKFESVIKGYTHKGMHASGAPVYRFYDEHQLEPVIREHIEDITTDELICLLRGSDDV